MTRIAVYSPQSGPRVRYIAEFFFGRLGEVSIVENIVSLSDFDVIINYSNQSDIGHLDILPCGLLFERGIRSLDPEVGTWKGIPTLFPNRKHELPFDLLSAVFFCISRYEEYGEVERDNIGRFWSTHSHARKHHYLSQPVIDQWLLQVRELLVEKLPHCSLKKPVFESHSTIDIDSAFAYKNKGFKRTLGGIAKDILKFDFPNLKSRLTALWRGHDVYDTYDFILNQTHHSSLRLFFLLSDFGSHDKNVPHTSVALQSVIRRFHASHAVGIHPGIGSHREIAVLREEIRRLSDIIGEPVLHSRQHYLKMALPETYDRLIQCGIRFDYSMGYNDQPGFRAGTGQPFFWYNVLEEKQTELTVIPFCVMEATLRHYLHCNESKALDILLRYKETCANAQTRFTTLWHNESLSEIRYWEGYSEVYRQIHGD